MRSSRFTIAGILALLIGGAVFAGSLYFSEASESNAIRACVGPEALDAPAGPGVPTNAGEVTTIVLPSASDTKIGPVDETAPLKTDEEADKGADEDPSQVSQPELTEKEKVVAELTKLLEKIENGEIESINAETFPFTVTISGRVIDDAGRGVDGAQVSARFSYALAKPTAGEENSRRRVARSSATDAGVVATTDAGGHYSATITARLAAEVDLVNVAMSATAERFAPGAAVVLKDVKQADQRTGVDLTMFSAGIATGRVVDRQGSPMKGVTVRCIQGASTRGEKQSEPARRSSIATHTAQTDADGKFKMTGLIPGDWIFFAASKTHQEPDQPEKLTVLAGSEHVLPDIVMAPFTSVRVRLLHEDGTVVTERPSVTLYFKHANNSTRGLAGRADAEGYVTITGVPADATEFSLSPRGYEAITGNYLRLIEGQLNEAGEFRIRPSPAKVKPSR
ncbi:MAG: carboxypeptidase regulatory-like domain-containing protein [Planctomycetes bacterium]|nr:carboxypeptidase regulatory-like domain-containing protein [Planctomycetota bacterium]